MIYDHAMVGSSRTCATRIVLLGTSTGDFFKTNFNDQLPAMSNCESAPNISGVKKKKKERKGGRDFATRDIKTQG